MVGLVDLHEDAARAGLTEFGLTEARTGSDLGQRLAATSPDLNICQKSFHLLTD